MRGDREAMARELAVARQVEHQIFAALDRGELAWWLHVAGAEGLTDVEIARAFGLMLEGDWVRRPRTWAQLGMPVVAGGEPGPLGVVDDAREAGEQLRTMGADATRLALLRDRHEAGLTVPRGPRQQTRGNSAGLTLAGARGAALLAEGLTNAAGGRTALRVAQDGRPPRLRRPAQAGRDEPSRPRSRLRGVPGCSPIWGHPPMCPG